LRTFRNCLAVDFIRLRRLHFEFYLPVETVLDESDLDWSHLDHDAVRQQVVGKVLVLYTTPYLFHQQRQLYNHACDRPSTSSQTIERLQWTLDCDPSSIDATLMHLQCVHSLELFADIQVCVHREDYHHTHRA
jgi:hypothetical protein